MADEKVAAQAVDLNDPSLVVENLEVNVDADQFAFPAPPPAGVYEAKLKIKQTDGSDFVRKVTKKGKAYLQTQLELRLVIVGGELDKYDNWPIFDNFVSTLVNEQQGTNKMVGILKALGKQVPAKTNDVELCKMLRDAVAGEPSCKVSIEWEASAEVGTDSDGNKVYERFKGMKRFPMAPDGKNHLGVVQLKGVDAPANAVVLKYLPL
jgi:hypothetical protein